MKFVLILAFVFQQAVAAQALRPTPTSRQTPGNPGSSQDPLAQQAPGTAMPSGTDAAAGTPMPSPRLERIANDNAEPKDQGANTSRLGHHSWIF